MKRYEKAETYRNQNHFSTFLILLILSRLKPHSHVQCTSVITLL